MGRAVKKNLKGLDGPHELFEAIDANPASVPASHPRDIDMRPVVAHCYLG